MQRTKVTLFALLLIAAPTMVGFADDKSGKKVSLFNGKDLTGWATKGGSAKETLRVGAAAVDPKNPAGLIVRGEGNDLVNHKGGARDFYTEKKVGGGTFEVEFMVPKGSNSGVYLMGEYEIQILDSYGKKKFGPGDVGGLYGAQAPRVNAAKAPGEWQKFVIDFRAPKFDANGKKTANARFVKVTLNGKLIHENVEMKGPTPGGLTGREASTGPLMFQGNHGPVAYRNIKFKSAD
ncbi:MAG: DUF1080 domain-containing protein [Pirellulaceae bacterium]|jgi:hypothetical protein|nr:DUF1080 domain-containing protein [Pirellulaceae bacterium]MDP7017784.1 DUF1080 domain-containing protein [Pirellulaceae bacterium]